MALIDARGRMNDHDRGNDADEAGGNNIRVAQRGSTFDQSCSQSLETRVAVDTSSSSSSTQRRLQPCPPPPSTRARPTLQRSNDSTLIQGSMRNLRANLRRQSGQSFRSLKRRSDAMIEGIHNNLPTSPSGWALLACSAASLGLQYELKIQKELTMPPIVFCQESSHSVLNERMDRIYRKLSRSNNNNTDEGIFTRKITPSLGIGTRGVISSTAAYLFPDINATSNTTTRREREVMKMGADGALLVLDWEIPLIPVENNAQLDIKKPNSIDKPVVLILHGMNNDSTFGYVRSMMRTATERGWIAVCMNLRGQDGLHQVKSNSPRGYNAGYTGDLRSVIHQIEFRLKRTKLDNGNVEYMGGPLFLLGYSLGANIITKYLGEESLHGTLSKCIGGGAAMGNPLHINSGSIHFPWNILLAAGIKRSLLQNFKAFRQHHDPGFQRAMVKACMAPTIGQIDDIAAPYVLRNDNHPPYTTRIGYKDGEEYWWDSSSHRYVAHVSVPLLKISARDDFLVFGQFARKLNHCLENPNVVVVKTRCGGHLGWQESPPPSKDGNSKRTGSWSDVAVAEFIDALLQIREEDKSRGIDNRNHYNGDALPPKLLSKL
jgi:predicted alpha/beta-fold hydrolase